MRAILLVLTVRHAAIATKRRVVKRIRAFLIKWCRGGTSRDTCPAHARKCVIVRAHSGTGSFGTACACDVSPKRPPLCARRVSRSSVAVSRLCIYHETSAPLCSFTIRVSPPLLLPVARSTMRHATPQWLYIVKARIRPSRRMQRAV